MFLNRPLACAVVLLAAGGAPGCSDDRISGLWCGERLCEWEAQGEVEKAATWHGDEPGIKLHSHAGIVHQARWKPDDGRCIAFSLVANFDDDATVYVQVSSILSDTPYQGWQMEVPLARWRQVGYRFPMKGEYAGLYFWVLNSGPASAIVSHLDVAIAPDEECPEDRPVRYPPLPE